MAKSQEKRILAHLQHGGSITPLTALRKFGCLRLSGRIYDIKAHGTPNIQRDMVKVNGKYVAQYRIGD